MPVLVVTDESTEDCTLSFVELGDFDLHIVTSLLRRVRPTAQARLVANVGLAADPTSLDHAFCMPTTEEELDPYLEAPRELRAMLAKAWGSHAGFKPMVAKFLAGKPSRFAILDDL